MKTVANDNTTQQAFAPVRAPIDPRRCVILVPFSTHIAPACERGLIELQRRGYEVWRVGGYSAIDAGRNELATKALALTPSATSPHPGPLPAGEGTRAIAAHTLHGTTQIGMGKGSGLLEIMYAGTGFLHVRREVYTAIREKLKLPLCNAQFGRPMVPFFQPMIVPWERGAGEQEGQRGEGKRGEGEEATHWYLGEDYSFCERARQCGYKIMADTSIRLWHIGEYAYGWEDAGLERVRHDSFLFMIEDGKKQ